MPAFSRYYNQIIYNEPRQRVPQSYQKKIQERFQHIEIQQKQCIGYDYAQLKCFELMLRFFLNHIWKNYMNNNLRNNNKIH